MSSSKSSYHLLSSKILSPSPEETSTKSEIISLISILGGNAVSCIDSRGCLSIFPTSPKDLKVASVSSSALSSPLVMNVTDGKSTIALCQVEAKVMTNSNTADMSSVLWVGCSSHKGIAYVTLTTENLDEDLPKLGKVLKKKASPSSFIGAFNESITHMCLVPFMNSAPAIASIGNNGNCSIWDINKKSCLVSVDMTAFIPMAKTRNGSETFQVTAFTPHLYYDSEKPKENSSTSIWISDSTGHLSCYDAETLEPYFSYNNHFLAKKLSSPITSIVSLPELNFICAGEEDGRLVLIKPPSKQQFILDQQQPGGLKSPDFSTSTYPMKHIPIPSHNGSPVVSLTLSSSEQLRSGNNSSAMIWSSAMNGSVVLVDPTVHSFTPDGEFNSAFAEKLVIDVSGEQSSSSSSASASASASAGNVFITSLASYMSLKTGDEILVSGGTSKIITLQSVVTKDVATGKVQQASQIRRASMPAISLTNASANASPENFINNKNDDNDDDEHPFASTASYNDFAKQQKAAIVSDNNHQQQRRNSNAASDEVSYNDSPINSLSLQEREHISSQMRRASITKPTTEEEHEEQLQILQKLQQQQHRTSRRGTAPPSVLANKNVVENNTKISSASSSSSPRRTSKNDEKINILMKRVAELELDLLQAQAVGSELTKRLLSSSEQQKSSSSSKKEKSSSPRRGNNSTNHHSMMVPKSSVAIQVDFEDMSSKRAGNSKNIISDDVAAQYLSRIEELETENLQLRERLTSSKYVLNSTDVVDENGENDQNENQQQQQQDRYPQDHSSSVTSLNAIRQESLYRASPSRSRGRPMDDYELRCMQRLILENEKLRSDLHTLRLSAANSRSGSTHHQKTSRSHSVVSQQQTSEETATEEESHNILTVCFLTLRSVLGHHRAAEIVLAAIGDEEEELENTMNNNNNNNQADKRASEVQTIEKLVYELATRLDPRHRGAPEEL